MMDAAVQLKGIRLPFTEPWTSKVVRWLPPLLWGALVLSLSALPDVFFFGAPHTRDARRVHYYLELAVHLFQFCVFFLLMSRPLRSAHRSRAGALAGAFTGVLLLSLANESLQALTPTRMFDFADMAMDALGGLVGLGLVLFLDASGGAGLDRRRLLGRATPRPPGAPARPPC